MEKSADYSSGWSLKAFNEAAETVARLKSGAAAAVELAVQFLERDDYFHGTGYIKEKMWRHLRHVALCKSQKKRLRRVALVYVQKRLTREFFRCAVSSVLSVAKFICAKN